MLLLPGGKILGEETHRRGISQVSISQSKKSQGPTKSGRPGPKCPGNGKGRGTKRFFHRSQKLSLPGLPRKCNPSVNCPQSNDQFPLLVLGFYDLFCLQWTSQQLDPTEAWKESGGGHQVLTKQREQFTIIYQPFPHPVSWMLYNVLLASGASNSCFRQIVPF